MSMLALTQKKPRIGADDASKSLAEQFQSESLLWKTLRVAGTTTGAYHGYKRNNSIGWALVWGFLGGAAPFITIPVSLAQGFGKRG